MDMNLVNHLRNMHEAMELDLKEGMITIKDRNGYPIAQYDDKDNEISMYDINNHYLGKYDKRSNTTLDANNHLVSQGNTLGMLISSNR